MSVKERISGVNAKGQFAILTDYQYQKFKRKQREERTRNLKLAASVLVVIVFFLISTKEIVRPLIINFMGFVDSKLYITVAMSLVAIAAVAKSFFTYLDVEKPDAALDPELEKVLARSIEESNGREEIARAHDAKREEASRKAKGQALGLGVLEDSEREEFIKELQERLENEALLSYRDKLIALTEKKFLEDKIDGVVKAFIVRLEKEIYGLGRRANVNLFIGIIISAVGLVYMGWVVKIAADMNFNLDSLAGFIPKFSFVVLVEVFAYFFLRIYKGAQAEIKYFQNEISNIELKYMSVLMVSDKVRDVDSFRNTVGALAASERNFILERGQTTASLEEMRQDNVERKNLIDALLKMSNGNK